MLNELTNKVGDAIAQGLTEDRLAKMRKQVDDMFREAQSDFEYWLQCDTAANLASFAQRMADEAIEKLLRGDVDEMRLRLRCCENQWTGRDREHWVIHGRLSEHDPMLLRKQIVDAFPELLKSERILDLEDQVKSLVQRVNKAEAEREGMWERLRPYVNSEVV